MITYFCEFIHDINVLYKFFIARSIFMKKCVDSLLPLVITNVTYYKNFSIYLVWAKNLNSITKWDIFCWYSIFVPSLWEVASLKALLAQQGNVKTKVKLQTWVVLWEFLFTYIPSIGMFLNCIYLYFISSYNGRL